MAIHRALGQIRQANMVDNKLLITERSTSSVSTYTVIKPFLSILIFSLTVIDCLFGMYWKIEWESVSIVDTFYLLFQIREFYWLPSSSLSFTRFPFHKFHFCGKLPSQPDVSGHLCEAQMATFVWRKLPLLPAKPLGQFAVGFTSTSPKLKKFHNIIIVYWVETTWYIYFENSMQILVSFHAILAPQCFFQLVSSTNNAYVVSATSKKIGRIIELDHFTQKLK